MKSTELTALVVSASMMVTGTYAWQAFSQRATNETLEETEDGGGRLHDDFDGSDKDVYVENYSQLGGSDIYARVQLREYMEYGTDAGSIPVTGSSLTLVRGDKQVTATPDITDMDTWDIYLYGSTATGAESTRSYRDLGFEGSTIYMPTFNQDNTDLAADINGTYIGPDGDRDDSADKYLDYVNYTTGQTKVGNVITATDNAGTSATHTAKATADATVMTMAEWLALEAPLGDYWVYDVDGWAYYANPIKPKEATGLLLDEIIVTANPDTTWYYAVDVVAQLATAGDWGDAAEGTGMHGEITTEGLGLLDKISGNMKIDEFDVLYASGKEIPNYEVTISYQEVLSLMAKVDILNGSGAAYETQVTWDISQIGNASADLSAYFSNGVFTPDNSLIDESFEVVVTSRFDPAKTITVTIHVVDVPDAIEVASEDDRVDVKYDGELQLYAYVAGTTIETPVTWSIVESSGNSGVTPEQLAACVDENGLFTPTTDMAGCTYTVTATSVFDGVAPASILLSVYDESAKIEVSSAGNVTSMTLSPTYYELQMTATVTGLLDQSVIWTVTENSGNSGYNADELNATIDENGLFTVTDVMAGGSYTITATSKADGSLLDSMIISITAPVITVTADENATEMYRGEALGLTATVVGLRDQNVSWEISGNDDEDTTIDATDLLGTLTSAADETVDNVITVIVTSVSAPSVYGELQITIIVFDYGSLVGGNESIEIDGISWYVLDYDQVMEYTIDGNEVKLHDAYLIWAADSVALNGTAIEYLFHGSAVSTWSTSLMNTTTLPTWLATTTTLKDMVIRTVQDVDGTYSTTASTPTTAYNPVLYSYSEAFLLSQPEYLSYIGLSGDPRGKAYNPYFIRSPNTAARARRVTTDGTDFSSTNANSAGYGVRPALWVVL